MQLVISIRRIFCGQTKISDFKITFIVKYNILWIEILMNDSLIMNVFESFDKTGTNKFGLFFWELFWEDVVDFQITSSSKI